LSGTFSASAPNVRICAGVWASGESFRDTFESRQGEARRKKLRVTPRQPDFISDGGRRLFQPRIAEHLKSAEKHREASPLRHLRQVGSSAAEGPSFIVVAVHGFLGGLALPSVDLLHSVTLRVSDLRAQPLGGRGRVGKPPLNSTSFPSSPYSLVVTNLPVSVCPRRTVLTGPRNRPVRGMSNCSC
jgi:hypothetical protein